jgi:hypothetical protein
VDARGRRHLAQCLRGRRVLQLDYVAHVQ